MKLSNIRMGICDLPRIFHLFPVVIWLMCMPCDCHESPMRIVVGKLQFGTTRAILCEFHKTPLRLPYVLCACPAIATRHPRDQSECHTTPLDFCFTCDSHRKRRTSEDFSYGQCSWWHQSWKFVVFVFMRTQVYPHNHNLIVINRVCMSRVCIVAWHFDRSYRTRVGVCWMLHGGRMGLAGPSHANRIRIWRDSCASNYM